MSIIWRNSVIQLPLKFPSLFHLNLCILPEQVKTFISDFNAVLSRLPQKSPVNLNLPSIPYNVGLNKVIFTLNISKPAQTIIPHHQTATNATQ